MAAGVLPTGSKERHLLLEQLRCRGNYQHNIEVIRQGSGEIVPWRRPSQEVDARNYLPCPGCLGFFLRADLWKHQASCRRKMASDPAKDSSHPTADPSKDSSSDPTSEGGANSPEDPAPPHSGESSRSKQLGASDTEPPRKRRRVQAAASRLLPISSGASESCSEVLHRMNRDHVSHQVKSDWLICKYGNTLMGNQDGSQMRYEYVSQKLRKLGKLLLAAKSLDSAIQNLHDLLAPGCLSLALAAARKASGYRCSCLPRSVKTLLKAVCEIAIRESLQNGDAATAARTDEFYHLLGRDWDNLRLSTTKPAAEEEKRQSVQPRGEKKYQGEGPGDENSDLRPPMLSKGASTTMESTLQPAATAPSAPRKVHRRPWSSAEKEAVWRQLGVHVLVQTVPGKEVCERCLDLEPVLRGRHWKDIKNQVHNQIQSQKKQQFHAQIELLENQVQQDLARDQKMQQQSHMNLQSKDLVQSLNKQQCPPQLDLGQQISNHVKHKCQPQVDGQAQDYNKNKPQCQAQMDHQHHMQAHEKDQYHARLDYQEPVHAHKKHLYHVDQQNHRLQMSLKRDTFTLSDNFLGPDGPEEFVDRDSAISPYELGRTTGPNVDQILSGRTWADECLGQNYAVSRPRAKNLLQEAGAGTANPHSGFIRY
ncbi:uncharacterized protein LOC133397876 [Phycodurus eques]|uniref:uncharacterized protein LOC133397876 n=1 Tax=Phycodurus eques TaxID=693459 RepID=UPI002ACDF6EF|nr:uncharacterized protein LOC133397876 [Phycodurus eques]